MSCPDLIVVQGCLKFTACMCHTSQQCYFSRFVKYIICCIALGLQCSCKVIQYFLRSFTGTGFLIFKQLLIVHFHHAPLNKCLVAEMYDDGLGICKMWFTECFRL